MKYFVEKKDGQSNKDEEMLLEKKPEEKNLKIAEIPNLN